MTASNSSALRLVAPFRNRPWRGYAFAVGSFTAALGARFGLDDVLADGFPFLTFFPAIVLSTLLGGRGPGAACACVSVFAAWYWFIEPRNSLDLNANGVFAMGFFAVVAAVDVWVIDLLTRSLQSLDALQRRTDELVIQRTTLFHELQHRVANNLMVVAMSLAVQKRRLKNNPEAVEALETARHSFEVLSRIHRRLYDPANANIAFGPYLQALCNDFLGAADAENIRCTVDCPQLTFDADRAITLSLFVLEAVTNAVKHAFDAGQAGQIAVRLSPETMRPVEYVLTVEDNGRGVPRSFDVNQSERLGMGILKGFARALGGQIAIAASETGGTIVRMRFPETQLASPRQVSTPEQMKL